MNTIQVSFRLPQDVYKQFDEKIKLSGKTKQHIFVNAIEDFLKGDGEVSQGVGSGLGSIDTKDIDEVVKDYLPELASLVALNPEFLAMVADKVKDNLQENVKDTKEIEVLESNLVEIKEDTVEDIVESPVKDNLELSEDEIRYRREVHERLIKLPNRLTQAEVETALCIPKTYLSKYKDKPEKLVRWDYFLKGMKKLPTSGLYVNARGVISK